jgi:chemotaxis protein MotB
MSPVIWRMSCFTVHEESQMIVGRVLVVLSVFLVAGCSATSPQSIEPLLACRQRVTELEGRVASCDQGLRQKTSARQLAEKRLEAFKRIAQKVSKVRWMFDPGELTFDVRGGDLVVELPHSVLFETGETKLKTRGKESLAQVATILKTLPERRFLVAGHTDNVPVAKKGLPFATNWELSAHRALTVVAFLQKQGVDPKQLGAVAFGPNQPITSNATEKGRARNRRIEILIQPTVDEIVPLPDEIGGEVPDSER